MAVRPEQFQAKIESPASDANPATAQIGFAQVMPILEQLRSMATSISPQRLQRVQEDYMREAMALWTQAQTPQPSVRLDDRRFKAPAWSESPTHAMAAAWYLLNSRTLEALANAVETDAKTRERLRFAVEQWSAAVSPSNFFAFNPEAQAALLETRGESLRQGLTNLLADLERGKISQSDESSFAVGRNLAVTPGAVIFENELMQLIEYAPTTSTVHVRPLLIVPPCINKFYILDLQPASSLVAHALDAGHRVFMISWRNADQTLASKTWDDYVEDGVLEAIETVRAICGRQEQINTLGFCIGGTLLATALAVSAARRQASVASMTLLTAMLDFSDTGILDIFIDEAHVRMREQTIGGVAGAPAGLMRGVELANVFSFLRPNDLVWNYVVANYLKGNTPPAFDLLYWNADATNLPGPMYAWYLRNTYLENRLTTPGAATVCGVPIDLGTIDMPTFVYGSREDHIVPWRTAYESTRLLPGPTTFVLGASGHIAGVINPPAKGRRSYWCLDHTPEVPLEDAEAWFAEASEQPGSWWPAWTEWLNQYAGARVKAHKQPGSIKYPAREAAPGRYAMERI
jgi:polyhydroxyalkanoate synthase